MKNKRILFFSAVLALMLCIWWWHSATLLSSSSARIEADTLVISPRIDGYIVEMPVREGDRVKAGQMLARLDSAALETALAREEAKLAALEAAMPGAPGSRPDKTAASLDYARQEEAKARREVERLSVLQAAASFELAHLRAGKGPVKKGPAKSLSAAVAEDNVLRSALAAAKEQLEAASARRAGLERRLSAVRSAGRDEDAMAALRAAQEAAVRQARQELEAAVLKAPADGTVLARAAGPGLLIQRGQTLLMLFPSGSDHIRVSAAFPKAAASRLRPGQRCAVTVEGYAGPELSGFISGVFPFALGPEAVASPETVSAHVTLDSYDPALMPALPVNAKARVVVLPGRAEPASSAVQR